MIFNSPRPPNIRGIYNLITNKYGCIRNVVSNVRTLLSVYLNSVRVHLSPPKAYIRTGMTQPLQARTLLSPDERFSSTFFRRPKKRSCNVCYVLFLWTVKNLGLKVSVADRDLSVEESESSIPSGSTITPFYIYDYVHLSTPHSILIEFLKISVTFSKAVNCNLMEASKR